MTGKNAMLRLGFDVGGTNVAAGLIDDDRRLVLRVSERYPRGRDGAYLASMLRRMADRLCAEAGVDTDSLERVGVALPGTLDETGQTVINAHNLGFHQVPLAHLLQERFPGSRICLLNDADAATLAELVSGALQGCETGLLLTLGTGLGGGIVSGGRLFHGGMGRGVELGHIVLHQGGRLCTCGQRGCAECYCSATALARAGRRSLTRAPHSLLARRSQGRPENVSARLVIDCARRADPTAVKLFDAYLDELAALLASLVNLLDPQVMAIGGGVGQSGDFLCRPLGLRTAEKCFHKSCGQIVPASLGNDAGVIGAALSDCLPGLIK